MKLSKLHAALCYGALLVSAVSFAVALRGLGASRAPQVSLFGKLTPLFKYQEDVDQLRKDTARLTMRLQAIGAAQDVQASGGPNGRRVLSSSVNDLGVAAQHLRDVAQLRCKLLLFGKGALQDDLFSADYYVGIINDVSSSSRQRARAFHYLGQLDVGRAHMTDEAESIWVRDALLAVAEEDRIRLATAFGAFPGGNSVRTVLMDYARFANEDRVRSAAIEALFQYEDDEEAWGLVLAAKGDPSSNVREAVADVIVQDRLRKEWRKRELK
jgi:hypothetical protein